MGVARSSDDVLSFGVYGRCRNYKITVNKSDS